MAEYRDMDPTMLHKGAFSLSRRPANRTLRCQSAKCVYTRPLKTIGTPDLRGVFDEIDKVQELVTSWRTWTWEDVGAWLTVSGASATAVEAVHRKRLRGSDIPRITIEDLQKPPMPMSHDDAAMVFELLQILSCSARSPDLEGMKRAIERKDDVALATLLSTWSTYITGIDFPLCNDCGVALMRRLQRELDAASSHEASLRTLIEREDFGDLFLEDGLESGEGTEPEDPSEGEDELAALEAELAALECEEKALEREELIVASKGDKVTAIEDRYWKEINEMTLEFGVLCAEVLSYQTRTTRSQMTLQKLAHITVPNDAFLIHHDGPFVTIAGFRLGRLQAQPVEWEEINAALGCTALLLTTVANQIGFIFPSYRVVPMGSFSRIAKNGEERTAYDLYYDNRMFARHKFNAALKTLLTCMMDLETHARTLDASLQLPYEMAGDRVGGFSVALGSKDEDWTRAMKFMLTNLKWLLAWVHHHTRW